MMYDTKQNSDTKPLFGDSLVAYPNKRVAYRVYPRNIDKGWQRLSPVPAAFRLNRYYVYTKIPCETLLAADMSEENSTIPPSDVGGEVHEEKPRELPAECRNWLRERLAGTLTGNPKKLVSAT